MIEEGDIIAKNKKASYQYFLTDRFIAGMQLSGTEIKSIRAGKANLMDAYCLFQDGVFLIRNLYIEEYSHASHFNHEAKRDRKLLLKGTELKKIQRKLKDSGVTIVPTVLFISQKGWAKIEIAIATGKKMPDKRQDLKDKDMKRQIDRLSKDY
ncbi:MAG: SsrA-binding protein SmpB [Bacteroidota bacterium]